MHVRTRNQPGQSMAVLAIFAATLFIFMGLGIDSGMLYLERRHLQNVADAMCLAATTDIALSKDQTGAANAAKEYFTLNMNANGHAAFTLPTPVDANVVFANSAKQGTGTSLTHGIEVANGEARVAITLPASTYFLRLGGITTYNVTARARCQQTQGGGVLPVAVVRFPGYDQADNRVGLANTGLSLPQTYGNGRKPKTLVVRDVLQRRGAYSSILNNGPVTASSPYHDCASSLRNWFDWPSVNVPNGPFRPPTTACAATDSDPGYEVELVGRGADANVGDTSFSGPVLLDVRGISQTPHQYYNGQSGNTSTNAWKKTVENYIRTRYPGPDVQPGEQLGVLSGISAGVIIDAIDDKYNAGDIVTALVYNGQVYEKGDFLISITCKQGSAGCDNTGSNDGRTVTRAVPNPDPKFDNNCTSFDGSFYIGDSASFPDDNPAMQPAQYVVKLAPTRTNPAALSIKLTARISGVNVGAGGVGSPDALGKIRVRWKDATGNLLPGQKDPINPNDAAAQPQVSMPLPNGAEYILEVIQEATKQVQCVRAGTTYTFTVPDRVPGALTVQVSARADTSVQHSTIGLLALEKNRGGNQFDEDDFFAGFASDPVGTVQNESPDTSLSQELSLVDANSTNDDELKSRDVRSCRVAWYNQSGAAISTPAGASAYVDLSRSGQNPTLRVSVPNGMAAGEYQIDVECTTDASGAVRSTRYHLRVENAINPSIDEWVVALCYADFRITSIDRPNTVKGQAISGCKNADEVARGLTSRLLPWQP